MQKAWVQNHPSATAGQHVALCLGSFALSLFVAYAALKLYDQPVRAWLGKLGKR